MVTGPSGDHHRAISSLLLRVGLSRSFKTDSVILVSTGLRSFLRIEQVKLFMEGLAEGWLMRMCSERALFLFLTSTLCLCSLYRC